MSAGDATEQAILDAARDSILHFGIRRTALSDIARRADVSRMTVYRRFPDVDAIVRELMTREFAALAAGVLERVDGADGRERLVRRLVTAIAELRDHPLMRKVIEAEPDLLVPYLLGRMGGTQRNALAIIRAGIAEGQADGSVAAHDPEALALSVLLVAQSFALATGLGEGLGAEAIDAEFERVLDVTLRLA